MKKWIYKDISVTRADRFAKDADIGLIFSYLLLNRGIETVEQSRNFIYPNINNLYNPFLLTGMKSAVERINKAAENHEKVTIFGDYDVDGLTSTAILVDALSLLGIKADVYIPDRIHEGYGLNINAIKSLAMNGTKLIITVDLGISAVDEVNYGKSLGIDFVITDHHQIPNKMPDACAIINPKREDCHYPYKQLAGVGVAFKLASALLSDTMDIKSIFVRYVDLVCLGTISDIVSLTDENRLYAKYGLKHFHETKNQGIKALIKYSGYDKRVIDETAIGFGIAPRINSAGRMGRVELAHKLLTTTSSTEAETLASMLCDTNNQRRSVEQEIYEQVITEIDNSDQTNKVIIAYGKNWHVGIIGIVAAKIMDRYYKPVILLSIDENGLCHGSARSIPGFSIFEALSACGEILEKFGGHDMAAGLTIKEQNLTLLQDSMNRIAEITLSDDAYIPTLEIEYEAEPTEIDVKLAEKIKYFEPFGTDNPRPVFAMRNMQVVEAGLTRDGKHLRMRCSCMGKHFWCIGFNMADCIPNKGDMLDIAFNLDLNEYNGTKDINLIIKDIHKQ